jgi:hypothetical protein
MPDPAFKYAAHLAALRGCPPQCSPTSGQVFRVVHDPMVGRDFEPKGLHPKDGVAPDCSDWGLSMFTTADALQKRLGPLMRKYRNMINDIGGCIAVGTLTSAHGKATSPSRALHFDLYEFAGVNLAPLFAIVDEIRIPPPPPGGA